MPCIKVYVRNHKIKPEEFFMVEAATREELRALGFSDFEIDHRAARLRAEIMAAATAH